MTATTEHPTVNCPAWCRDHGEPGHVPGAWTEMCISDYDDDEVKLSLMPDFDFNGGVLEPAAMRAAYIVAYLVDNHEGEPVRLNIGRDDTHEVAQMTIDEAEDFFRKGAALVAAARAADQAARKAARS